METSEYMNPLETYIQKRKLDPIAVMNALQDNAVISDLCVWPADVGDAEKAVAWLEENCTKIPLTNMGYAVVPSL